jgi:RNA polymerase sigma factor for flagellar operon FliA
VGELLELPRRALPQAEEDALVRRYLPLVHAIARSISVRFRYDFDDAASDGCFGLVKAIRAYRPELGVPLQVYARTAIRRAIMDGLRSWRPEAGRTLAVVYLEDLPPCAAVPAALQVQPDDAAEQREALETVLRFLPPRWKLALELRYLREMPLDEVARIMGMSPSRVSQVIGYAIERLRCALTDSGPMAA